MSSKQKKEFIKHYKEAQSNKEWDMLMMMEVFMDGLCEYQGFSVCFVV